jgi:hypothetical protein
MWREGKERDFVQDAIEKNLKNFEKEISETLIDEIKETTK